MAAIIMETVLVAALVVAIGTLLYFGVTSFTPMGRRWARARAARAEGLACPIHGVIAEESVLRLPSGERACPHCARQTH